jgi:hypothetical protein
MKPRSKLRTGIILCIVSQLLGWGGTAFFCSLALKTSKPILCCFGIGLYALSWGMLGLCVMLVGTEGIHYVRDLFKKLVISLPLRCPGPKKDSNP